MAASGGYYIAMAVDDQTDSIFAEPTTTTGSIGVIIPHYDISGLLAKFDVKNDSVVNDAGQFKQLLSMTQSMDPDEQGIDKQEAEARRKRREILQVYVNESFDRFLDIVESGRPNMSEKEVTDAATGQIFTAPQAQERGLVDKIGFIEEAVDRAIQLADLEDQEDDVRVVRFQRPPTIMDLAGMEGQSPGGVDLSTLLDTTTPKAYYLATWLPGIVENE
jgi:protease-4